MNPLHKSLRNTLEKTVKDARKIAEDAARATLEQLGVGEAVPFTHLTEQERDLRRRLRVHGRQLGDTLNGGKDQTMDRLMEEVAYQHWHRMLFARFLAENSLLMYPDPDDPVAITLEECEDLAPEEGTANGWELAARYAARMLPQIFRFNSPVFQLALPPEYQQKLEHLVADLPIEVFTASDSIGWVYQFWQARKKDEVNASEKKIGVRELPAVTQLFTEPYMVNFLLDNSLGAWWAARRLTDSDLKTAATEEELRTKAAIPGVPLEYLRFIKQENDVWTPAAGTFEGWPENLSDLKTLDPCCGSGHFLVAIFLMLVAMRMELENLTAQDAVDAVLRENIHGLELDQRCVELAAFALALAAWKYADAGGYRVLPQLNLACSGLSISTQKEEWIALAGDNPDLKMALGELYNQFKDAPTLGSLINPESSLKKETLFPIKWEAVNGLLKMALAGEQDDEKAEMGVVAKGISKAASVLSDKYSLVITNVPYLARSKQDETLRDFCESHYNEGKNDLATVFLDRCLEFCEKDGTTSVVLPQNWLFLTSYKKFRVKLLKNNTWHLIARLGPQAFQTPMWDFNVQLIVLSRSSAITDDINLFDKNKPTGSICGLDVSGPRTAVEKSVGLLTSEIKTMKQAKQLVNPDSRVSFESNLNAMYLSKFAISYQGLRAGDKERFVLRYWEIQKYYDHWEHLRSSSKKKSIFDGVSQIICWEQGNGKLSQYAKEYRDQLHDMHESGNLAWGLKGVVLNQMGVLKASIYEGIKFDGNTNVIIPLSEELPIEVLWVYCSSKQYHDDVRAIDQKISVTNATLVKVPFDIDHWTKVAEEKYPNGLPKPYTNDLTQWIFHGHPCSSVIWHEDTKWTAHGPLRSDETVLHVAVARLLGYRWPAELDPDMELADEQREWVNRCQTVLPFADEDGIVCIPPVRGEAPAADRLLNLLAAAYGDAWSNNMLAQLLKNADHAGKTLETWLRDKFFTQHCKLFKHRPFIWHIWDGLQDGFSALVNYHKLDTKRLETLIYTYLGDWINRQKQGIIDEVDGARERLDAAEWLMKKLELILEGEAPYDIFVRWKPIDQQPIAWDPDLNDGVRLNIRPFMSVPDIRKKGAGILRDKPNIKWEKDRGKDVASAPWYHLFKGDRINDHHLTLSEKRAARENAK